MNNVISLKAARELKNVESDDLAYKAMILSMDQLQLLEEMVRFQEERKAAGSLSIGMMLKGKHLFKALEENAVTQELRPGQVRHCRPIDSRQHHRRPAPFPPAPC